MSVERADLRRTFAGRSVWVSYLLLAGPTAVGAIDTRLMTPLALPGYLALTLGSSVGSRLFPNFQLWVFWVPYFVGGYFVAVALAGSYRAVRRAFESRTAD